MNVLSWFLILGVTGLWAGMLGAVAYLAGNVPGRRLEEAAPPALHEAPGRAD